ncbi:MAG: hypothetical protein RKH07_13965 [Gammaproteobacteria bacterium]
MRFIDQDELEADLPPDWEDTVKAAWEYVNGKVAEAEQAAEAKADEGGLEGAARQQFVDEAITKARKKAIAYKSLWSDLAELLAEQSKRKCWYCETNEIRSDNPIDHFRPKGKVAECDGHAGYWWLAFDWQNFRYACTYCNSRRVDEETAGGKQDHFPLFVPPDWNTCEADDNVERPMLLDPVEEGDCRLLGFNENGEACPVETDKESEGFKKAKKSIELYHLNHKPTARARKTLYQRIRTLVSSTNELIAQGIDENSEALKSNRKELIRLIRHETKSTKFNTAARIYLMQFKDENAWVRDILGRA